MNPRFSAGLAVLCLGLCLAVRSVAAQTNLWVAADGSEPFRSVQAAIMSVPSGDATNPVVIRIKPGIYHELIYVQREKCHFRLVGENATNTILTYGLYASMTNFDGKPIGTFHTPSTTIDGDDFTADNLTFENSAGPVGQALAIRVDGDRAVFRHCRFLGCQDTILLNRGRQYFLGCEIQGTVDFIFGAGTAWFEQCHIICRSPGYVTAASTPVEQPYGFVFSHCQIDGATPEVRSYLGRPWRVHASTIYLNTEMSEVIRPEGWNDWKKPEAHQVTRYAEYHSTGPGGAADARADWSRQLTDPEAAGVTIANVLGGADRWDPRLAGRPRWANRDDLMYGVADGERLFLDAHVPDGAGTFPIVIIVHGGGWTGGDKEDDIVPVFGPAANGFTWFTINYRLAPAHRWPACREDVATAVRWVKAHAAEFKGDPQRVALMGYSAGGQLATFAGLTADADTAVQAVVGLAPPTDPVTEAQRRGSLAKWASMRDLLDATNLDDATLDRLAQLSPVRHIHPGAPPFLLVQGDEDRTVPPDLTHVFQQRLQAAGVACDFLTVTNAGHRIADWPKLSPGIADRIAGWLKDKLGN
jgi:pectinesterase